MAGRIAFDLARDQLSAELSGADSDDVKALSFLALDVALGALLVTERGDLNRFWWCAGIGLAVSGALLVWSLWRRTYDTGPDPQADYLSVGDSHEAVLPAMEAVCAAREFNAGVRRRKSRLYTASIWGLIATVVGGGFLLWQVH